MNGPRLVKSKLNVKKQDKNIILEYRPGCVAAEIPALKVSRDSGVVSSSGSWFHSLMPLYLVVLQYGTLYLYWWPIVAAPNNWRCGDAQNKLYMFYIFRYRD